MQLNVFCLQSRRKRVKSFASEAAQRATLVPISQSSARYQLKLYDGHTDSASHSVCVLLPPKKELTMVLKYTAR